MLTYRDRGTSNTQLSIVSASLVVGSLRKDVLSIAAGKVESWSWTLYVDSGPDGFKKHGSASNRDSAKADIERNWQLWIDAAGLGEVKP